MFRRTSVTRPRHAAKLALAALGAVTVSLIAPLSASAATATPPYEPDTQSVGQITFYDAAGNVVTSGSVGTAPIAAYAVGSVAPRAGDDQAVLLAAQPNPNTDTSGFNSNYLGSGNTYPIAAATGVPTDISSLTASNPVASGTSADLSLSGFIDEYPNTSPTATSGGCAYASTESGCTNTAYEDLYQIRLATQSSKGGDTLSISSYDVADVLVDEAAGTWSQVYPAVATGTTTTTTTVSADPTTASQGASVTLTATVAASDSSMPAGTVQFTDNGKTLGSAIAVDTTTETATLTSTTLPAGADSISASFTPSDTSTYVASPAATAVVVTINPVAPKPTVSGSSKVGTTDTCSATTSTSEKVSYKWIVSGSTVATTKTFKIPASDYKKSLSCAITVQVGTGTASTAHSNSVTVKEGANLKATKKPTISGTAKVGKTLKVSKGTWSPGAKSYTYQWLLNGKAIKKATKSSYKLIKADTGKKISCKVTAKSTGYANGTATTASKKVSK